jgi:hypothetical protein
MVTAVTAVDDNGYDEKDDIYNGKKSARFDRL